MTDDDTNNFDSDRAITIMREVTLGQRPARPDTKAEAKFRRTVRREIEEFSAERHPAFEVDIPFEWPSLD